MEPSHSGGEKTAGSSNKASLDNSRKRSFSSHKRSDQAPPSSAPNVQKRPHQEASSHASEQQKSGQSRFSSSSRDHVHTHTPHQKKTVTAPASSRSIAAPPTQQSDSAAPVSRLYHPFKANFNDHFETSSAALQDVLPVVQELRQLLRPSTPERFTIYDPYYCSGSVVQAWNALGVQHVLHENRDFYHDIAHHTVPGPFDALITNPPFSDDHIWRLLDFLVTQQPLRPWAFVAPDYIAAKPQYKAWVKKHFTASAVVPSPGPAGAVKGALRRPPPPIPSIESILPPFLLLPEDGDAEGASKPAENAVDAKNTSNGSDGNSAVTGTQQDTKLGEKTNSSSSCTAAASAASLSGPVGPEPFYIVPRARYDYAHPLGVGHDHSHFKSMWYVWAGRHTSEVLRGVSVALSGRGRSIASASSSSSGPASSSPSSAVAVVNGYQALVEGHYVSATDRRPNPEQRQRAAPSFGGGGHHRGRGRVRRR